MHFISKSSCFIFIIFSSSVPCHGLVNCSLSKSHPILAHVELSVVRTNEDVPQDPERSHGRRNVQSHEPGQTDRLPELRDLHDVVIRLKGEVHPSYVEVDVWEVWNRSTV